MFHPVNLNGGSSQNNDFQNGPGDSAPTNVNHGQQHNQQNQQTNRRRQQTILNIEVTPTVACPGYER